MVRAGKEEMKTRRRAILAAAGKVFDACGYSAATVDAMAVEAGVAKGSIYNYFSSKQDLFAQVVADAFSSDAADVDSIFSRQISAVAKLEGYLDHWFSRLGHYRKVGRLMLECWVIATRQESLGELHKTFRRLYATWRDRLAGLITQGIESGEFRAGIDPRTEAAMILGLLDGLGVQVIVDIGLVIDETCFTTMKRGVMVALCVDGGGADA